MIWQLPNTASSRRRHTRLLGVVLRVVVAIVGWHPLRTADALTVKWLAAEGQTLALAQCGPTQS